MLLLFHFSYVGSEGDIVEIVIIRSRDTVGDCLLVGCLSRLVECFMSLLFHFSYVGSEGDIMEIVIIQS